MNKRGVWAVVLVGSMALAGCTGKARLQSEAKQSGSKIDVTVNVDPPASGTLTFSGNPAFEKLGPQTIATGEALKLSVPVGGMPLGSNKVTMQFTGKGRGLAKTVKATGTLSFDRTAATPGLLLMASATRPNGPTLPCEGLLCGAPILPFGDDGKLYVDIAQCAGCVVDVGSQKIAVTADPFPTTIDMTDAIAEVALQGVTGISDVTIPLKITQGIDSGDATIEGKVTELLSPILRRVAHGGLKFGGEPASVSRKNAVVVRSDAGLFFRVVGAPAKMRDVGLVGVATVATKSLGTCGIYQNTATKEKVDVAHTGESYDITLYDRRTGKSVARRSFPFDNGGCADKIVAKVVTSQPNDPRIVSWVRGFLR